MMDYVWGVSRTIVELTNILVCYSQLLQMKLCDKKRRIAILYVCTILFSIVYNFFGDSEGLVLFNMAYCCIAVLFVIKEKRLKCFLLYPCAYMLETVVCIMCSYIVAMLLDIPHFILEGKEEMVILINASFFILVGLKYLYDKIRNRNQLKLAFDKAVYIAITIGAISFLFILSAVQYIADVYDIPYNQTNLLGFLLSCVCMIFFFLFLWLSTTIYKNNLYQKENDLMNLHMLEQERYIKLVIEKDIDMRRFRHDVKEHMWVVSKYIESSEYSQAKNYIDKMYDTFSDSQLIRYTGVTAVDAVISEKKRIMDDMGIKFEWEGSICEFPLRFEIFDVCTLFSNILNNAIEACGQLDDVYRTINMKVSIEEGRVYIYEGNVLKNPIIFDEKGNPVSIKSDRENHGYGSKNIRAVVEKYDGELQYKIEAGMFCIEIIV